MDNSKLYIHAQSNWGLKTNDDPKAIAKAVREIKAAKQVAKKYGCKEFYVYAIDEARGDMVTKAVAKNERDRKVRKAQCRRCPALCCRDLVLPINKPRTRDDIDDLKWQIQYDTVRVYVRSHRWYVVIQGRCIYLTKKNLCSIYERRPEECRKLNPPDCERYGTYYDVMIETPEQLDQYLSRGRRRTKARRR